MNRYLAAFLTGAAAASAQDVVYISVAPAPPAMTPVENPGAPAMVRPRTTVWSIGDPTPEEQYYLELMNRARANPTAEGTRLASTSDPDVVQSYTYFGVNLTTMQNEMKNLVVAPPLAMNAKLLTSARNHSADQLTNGFQGHTGSDGSSITTRLGRVGYSASYYAENVYASSKNSWFGHAGFEVDWGTGPDGMQTGRGHRAIIHAGFREVGVGIRNGTNGIIGPQVVTQDFGVPAGSNTPYVTGVAFYDLDADGFYDPGEGIGGVTVNVDGSAYHAVTASSGGYAVPVPEGAAQRTVTFSGNGLSGTAVASIASTNNNVKVDFKPVYTPPAVTGPAGAVIGSPSSYQMTSVGSASAYDWRYVKKAAATVDNAADLSRVTATSYAYVTSGAYQMTQPLGQTQSITYKSPFRAGTAPSLQFQSRLAAATSSQYALVQVSTDGGTTWTTVDSHAGTNTSGQSTYSSRTVSLSSVAGKEFQLRFAFSFAGTSYYTGTGASYGWYVDAINFTDITDMAGATITPLPAGASTFNFAPPAAGTWLLSGRATVLSRTMPFGPALEVIAAASRTQDFAAWASSMESSAGLPAGTLANAPSSDYNKDGVANLMAYALNLSPVANASSSLPRAVVSAGRVQLDYTRLTDRTDITITPQVSTDLVTWYSPGQSGAPAGFTDSAITTGGSSETRRASVPVSGAHRYLRLKVSRL